MKRLLVIVLLVLNTTITTGARQFLKLPALLEHYSEHKRKSECISFFDFIYMHYAGSDFDDSDQDRDQQLPFKAPVETIDSETLPLSTTSFGLKNLIVPADPSVFSYTTTLPCTYAPPVWQPPKLG